MEGKRKRNTENVRQSSIFFHRVHRLSCFPYLHPPWQHWRSEEGLILLRSKIVIIAPIVLGFTKRAFFLISISKGSMLQISKHDPDFPCTGFLDNTSRCSSSLKRFSYSNHHISPFVKKSKLGLISDHENTAEKILKSHLQVFGEEFWANCIIDVSHRFKSRQPHKISFNPNFLQLRR